MSNAAFYVMQYRTGAMLPRSLILTLSFAVPFLLTALIIRVIG